MRPRLCATLVLVTLAACGGSRGATDTTAVSEPAAAPTSTAVTATTEAPLSTVDEPVTECDAEGLRAAFKSKMVLGTCTENWAVGNLDRDTWNCPDAGCRQVKLFRRDAGTWTATATCDTTLPLTLWRVSCFRADLQPMATADVPSLAVQCRIWPANVALRNVAETGCTPPESVVNEALRGECDRWVDNFKLPLEKCDSGSAVRVLQKALKAKGHDVDVDGYFGTGTVRAVMDVQTKNSLLKTGLVDIGTWKAIFPGNAGLKGTDSNGDGVISAEELS
ncbi:MAG: peptidoglycan-binding domain-containing protein [Actinomycetota bacterium]